MIHSQLFKRLTNKYRLHWDHLNKRHIMGRLVINPGEKEWDEGGEGFTQVLSVVVETDKPYRKPNVKKALFDSLAYGGCDCEGDCCGCVSAYVVEAKQDEENNRWTVKLSGYRNI